MRSRIVGGIALFLGLTVVVSMLISHDPIELKPFLGGLLFIAMGGYYLFTGKRAATVNEFINEGKLGYNNPAVSYASLLEKAATATDLNDRMEALRLISIRNGLSEEKIKEANLAAQEQATKHGEEILNQIAKEHGLTEQELKELKASYHRAPIND